ncbi:hypothetical protein M9H77_15873 [Catharanthus roseus]|uniref:Uncharacterized protein n=1 Tax=Catharanthus roseus TaxID=4058 RepID=A0ACC0B071_CATRO|nr:hypothetical protein M9H77_15873 [Catharanthus roseus]
MEMISFLQTSINTRFDAFNGCFEVLDGKVSNIQGRLDTLDHKMTDTQERDKSESFCFKTGRSIFRNWSSGFPAYCEKYYRCTQQREFGGIGLVPHMADKLKRLKGLAQGLGFSPSISLAPKDSSNVMKRHGRPPKNPKPTAGCQTLSRQQSTQHQTKETRGLPNEI